MKYILSCVLAGLMAAQTVWGQDELGANPQPVTSQAQPRQDGPEEVTPWCPIILGLFILACGIGIYIALRRMCRVLEQPEQPPPPPPAAAATTTATDQQPAQAVDLDDPGRCSGSRLCH